MPNNQNSKRSFEKKTNKNSQKSRKNQLVQNFFNKTDFPQLAKNKPIRPEIQKDWFVQKKNNFWYPTKKRLERNSQQKSKTFSNFLEKWTFTIDLFINGSLLNAKIELLCKLILRVSGQHLFNETMKLFIIKFMFLITVVF